MSRQPLILDQMTMSEFETGLSLTKSIILPIGSVEQHGRHLPLGTDTLQAYEVCKKASCRVPLFVAPPIPYGYCRSTSCHPGTISITPATMKFLVKDIFRSCHEQGLRNFIVLSGHAGGAHGMALQVAGEELIKELPDIALAVLIEYELARKAGDGLIETDEDRHAGEIETSRIMHSHPELVKGEGEKGFPCFPEGILVRDKRAYWPNGVWGDPAKASKEKGRIIENIVVDKVVNIVAQMERNNSPS